MNQTNDDLLLPAAPVTRGELVRAWVRLGRPKFLLYSALLYALGAMLAAAVGAHLEVGPYCLGQAFVWCTHLMTHYCNEFFDLDADRANPAPTAWTGGSRVLLEGLLSPRVSLGTAFVLMFAALALAMCMPDGTSRWLALGTVALAWFYTAPPAQLNYRGLGELSVATVLHVLCPAVAFQLQAGHLDPVLALALFPTFVLQVVRMMVMNLLDYEGDRQVGKRTLVTLFQPRRAVWVYALGQTLAYGSLLVLVPLGLPLVVAVSIASTAPIALWQSARLVRGAHLDVRTGNNVVFWASTHVAFAVVASIVGVFLAAHAAGPDAPARESMALLLTIPLSYLLLAGPQIVKNRPRSRSNAFAQSIRTTAR